MHDASGLITVAVAVPVQGIADGARPMIGRSCVRAFQSCVDLFRRDLHHSDLRSGMNDAKQNFPTSADTGHRLIFP